MKKEKNYIKREAISLVTNTIIGMMSLIAISYIIGYAIKTGNTIILVLAIVLIIVVIAALILGFISSFAFFDATNELLKISANLVNKTICVEKNLRNLIECMRDSMKHNYPQAQEGKVNIWDIMIPKNFKYPNKTKLSTRKKYFEENGRFYVPIRVERIPALASEALGINYRLVDGYTSYIIALEDGMAEVEVEVDDGHQETLENILKGWGSKDVR